MKYWDEMGTKFGFGDGDSFPHDAWERRDVYVHAVNLRAKQLGSKCVVVPFDRPGMHNSCMVFIEDGQGNQVDPDGGMEQAISDCYEAGLDGLVEVVATKIEGWEQAVAKAFEDLDKERAA